MNERQRFRPFTLDEKTSVKLDKNPLVLVLCQIRWPEMTHLQGDILRTLAVDFGKSLGDYPVFNETQGITYSLTPDGVQQVEGEQLYQWHTIDGNWNVSLGRRFVTLYCTKYVSFDEFSQRMSRIVESVGSVLNIQIVERIGVRYVNRLPQVPSNLVDYFEPGVLGYSALPLNVPEARLVGNINHANYELAEVKLQVRSGVFPAGQTADPVIAPVDTASWVLDLDAYSEELIVFNDIDLLNTISKLSDTAYDYFKWIVSEGFVRDFGGA